MPLRGPALLFYFQAVAGTVLEPGVVAVIQTFGDRINFHPHLHFLVTEGGVDEAGVFQRMSSFEPEAERVGKYMIRTVLSLEKLSFMEAEGKVG